MKRLFTRYFSNRCHCRLNANGREFSCPNGRLSAEYRRSFEVNLEKSVVKTFHAWTIDWFENDHLKTGSYVISLFNYLTTSSTITGPFFIPAIIPSFQRDVRAEQPCGDMNNWRKLFGLLTQKPLATQGDENNRLHTEKNSYSRLKLLYEVKAGVLLSMANEYATHDQEGPPDKEDSINFKR